MKWFICWDDNDDPEIVIYEGDVEHILRGLPFRVIGKSNRTQGRNFINLEKKFVSGAHESKCYFLNQYGPLPVGLLLRGGVHDSRPLDDRRSQGVFYGPYPI